MNTFIKVLTATALLATQSDAKTIHNSCLRLTDATEGESVGEFFTNEAQLTTAAYSDDMRLHGIKTCHNSGKVTGIQFFMAQSPYSQVDEEVVELEPMGYLTGNCDYLELPEGLDEIKATVRQNLSGLSIQYKIKDSPNELSKEYGNVRLMRRTKWEFDDQYPVIGLYGRETQTAIAQLGFITLDLACQLGMPEDVIQPDTSNEEEVTVEVEAKEEELVKAPVDEEEEILVLGLPIFTIILIAIGTITGVSCLIVAIITLRKSKTENRVSTPPNTVVPIQSNRPRPKKSQSSTIKLTPKAADYDTGDTDVEKQAKKMKFNKGKSPPENVNAIDL